ncbi:MAG TPA: acyl-CoA thioesterase domain-containing protein [Actinomycetota bacterium]|nr:acyl-CoA thioesterase domain-containing protein [Actinomycetota bacterium]
MADAFYVPDGDRFVPTELTRGPWSADAQHAGPPAALLGRAIEALEPVGEMTVARFSMEVLGPVPLRPLRVSAAVVRPGRRVQLVEAALVDDEDEIALAAAWRIRPADAPGGQVDLDPLPLPDPEESPKLPPWTPGWDPSYFTAVE